MNMRFSCYAQPDGVTAQQYVGVISYTKKILGFISVTVYWTNWNVNSDPSVLPYDYFPGGEYPLPVDLKSTQFQAYGAKFNLQVNAEQSSFDFVPVASALDIGSGNTALSKTDYLTRYVGAYPPVAPKNSPFSSYTTAYGSSSNNNEQHIQITQRNGDWVYNQLMGTPVVSNCSFMCPSNNILINGPAALCSSTVYNLQNLGSAPNTTVAWTASPTGIVTIVPGGTQATLTANSLGTVTLSASISNSTSDCALTVTKQITSGNPPTPGITIRSIEPLNHGTQMDVTVNTTASTPYLWYVNSALVFTAYSTNATINGGNNCNVTNTLKVSVSNTCGASTASTTYQRPCTGPNFIVSPNPATGVITVSTTTSGNQNVFASKETTQSKIYQLKVLDQTGNIIKQVNYNQGIITTNVDLSNLPNALYTIQVYDNIGWTSQQVVILK